MPFLTSSAYLRHCVSHDVAEIRIWSNKASLFTKPQTEHVVQHQNLDITVNTGANANRRNTDGFSDQLSNLARHDFQHNGKSSSIFHGLGIVQQLSRCFSGFSLHAIRAELIDRLRCQADVAHHTDLFVDETLHEVDAFVSAFQLDCFSATFLHKPQGVSDSIIIASVEMFRKAYQRPAVPVAQLGARPSDESESLPE